MFARQCGDLYFIGNANWGEQYKDGRFLITDQGDMSLSRADKRSGVKWSGQVFFSYTARRLYNTGQGWADWQPYTRDSRFVFLTSKANSRWVVNNISRTKEFYTSVSKARCSEMPPD